MKTRMLLGAVALCASSFGLGGCATVIHGTSQPIDFRSDPAGADVALVTGLKCVSPCQSSMKRGKDSRVTFSKDGFKPVTIYIQSRTGGASLGNLVAGGLIGGVVDASNGASNHLYPNPVYVRLVPEGSDAPAVLLDKKGKVIGTVDDYNAKVAADVEKGLQKQGVLPMSSALHD